MLIKPAEVIVSGALDKIGKTLKDKGISLEDLLERGREIRAKWLKRNTELPGRGQEIESKFSHYIR
jgi:hypothetical protein